MSEPLCRQEIEEFFSSLHMVTGRRERTAVRGFIEQHRAEIEAFILAAQEGGNRGFAGYCRKRVEQLLHDPEEEARSSRTLRERFETWRSFRVALRLAGSFRPASSDDWSRRLGYVLLCVALAGVLYLGWLVQEVASEIMAATSERYVDVMEEIFHW